MAYNLPPHSRSNPTTDSLSSQPVDNLTVASAIDDSTLRILILEDSEGDAEIIKRRLQKTDSFSFRASYAETLSDAQAFLAEEAFHVVLLDLNLPDSWGLETLEAIQTHAPDSAIVVLTGMDNDEQGITAVQHGAQDYLDKASILTGNLPRSVNYAWQRQRIDAQLKQANEVLRIRSEELQVANEQRQQAEAEVRQHRDEIGRLNQLRSMNELTSNIAHEIRQPLQAILAYARSCSKRLEKVPIDCQELDRQLQMVVGESQRAGQIITQFCEYVAQPSPKHSTVDLRELLLRSLDSVDIRASDAEIQLKTVFESKQLAAHVDAAQIEQAMTYLLDNAVQSFADIDSTPPMHAREIVVTLEHTKDRATVNVRDTGKGTQLLDLEEMFEPFYSDKTDSIGLGLSISRKIAAQHGGTLEVVRNEGPGLSFQFTFPLSLAKS